MALSLTIHQGPSQLVFHTFERAPRKQQRDVGTLESLQKALYKTRLESIFTFCITKVTARHEPKFTVILNSKRTHIFPHSSTHPLCQARPIDNLRYCATLARQSGRLLILKVTTVSVSFRSTANIRLVQMIDQMWRTVLTASGSFSTDWHIVYSRVILCQSSPPSPFMFKQVILQAPESS
jgi:hypothetical protein